MANVLPAEEKKHLERSFRARFLLALALTLSGAAIVAMLALLPSLFAVNIARTAVENAARDRSHASDDQAIAARTQALIASLGPIATATSSPTSALTRALSVRPSAVSITAVTFSKDKNSIVLSGVSSSRDAVNQYRAALEKDGGFSSVAVPVSALVGTDEGRFTITLFGVI